MYELGSELDAHHPRTIKHLPVTFAFTLGVKSRKELLSVSISFPALSDDLH